MPRSAPHDEAMAEMCRGDLALALEVINGILTDGDQAELRIPRDGGHDSRLMADSIPN